MRARLIPAALTAAVLAAGPTVGPAQAMGCLQGAALGGVAGHMAHHTFLGIFGGCAGGMIVHRLYARWKKAHPHGTLNEFVADNKNKLPAGWADHLDSVGDSKLPAGSSNVPAK